MMFVDKKNSNYTVSNHEELFKIGARYFEEFKNGLKSFAISSTGYERSQQTTLLGIASYFDLKMDLKICIISDNLYNGVFRELVAACDIRTFALAENEVLRFQKFYNHFDFIDIADLVYKQTKGMSLNDVINSIKDHYDVIFWDVPELHKVKRNIRTFSSIIKAFDSIGIVAGSATQSTKNIKEVESFFLEHGINLSGMIFNSPIVSPQKKRSFWSLR